MNPLQRHLRTLATGVADGVRALWDLLAWGEVQPRAADAAMLRHLARQIGVRMR